MKSLIAKILGLTLVLGVASMAAHAETYPEKGRQLTIIAPFPPGGATDILARMLGQRLSEMWGVTAVVDNRPGADSIIGISLLSKAKPDGYTFGIVTAEYAINRALKVPLPYDPVKDLVPVALLAQSPIYVVVNANSPAKTFSDLVAAAKSNPGKLSYGSCCQITHISTERLNAAVGMKTVEIPYKGSSPSVTGLLSGDTDFVLESPVSIKSHVEAGKLRILAVTTKERSPAYPAVPTLTELGVPGNLEMTGWWGILVPAKTDPEKIARLNAALKEIIDMPETRKKLAELDLQPTFSSPEALGAFIQNEYQRMASIVSPDANRTAK